MSVRTGQTGAGTDRAVPAGPRATTTFHQVADLGGRWTFVVTYGGLEVSRQTISGPELAGRAWTVQVPAAATAELERQGFE